MKKSVVVLIVILILLVLGMGGYLVYDKVLSKDEVKEAKVEQKEKVKETKKEIDINSDLVLSLTDMVEKYTVAGDLRNAIPYDETKEIVLKNDISDDMKGAIAFNLSKIDDRYLDKTDMTVENGYKITDEGVSIIKNNFIKLFGYDGFKEATTCPNVRFINNSYYELTGCGYGPYINTSAISAVSALEKDGDIILKAKIVFALWDGSSDYENFQGLILSTNRYDEEKKNVINKLDENTYQNIIHLNTSDFNQFYNSLKQYASDNSNLLDTYIYRFKKNSNSYYLYSVKKS